MENVNTTIKIMFIELESELNKKELILQEVINTLDYKGALQILKEIVEIELSIEKLKKMI